MGKRIIYSVADYAQLQHRLEQILAECTPLQLSPEEHHVTVPPADIRITYLPQEDMARFADIAHFASRSIKLINYGHAATRLHYLQRHKYQIRKNLPVNEVLRLSGVLLQQLAQTESIPADTLALVRQVQQSPVSFEVALSNYHQRYIYPYICYRYHDGRGYSTSNTHLTKQQNVLFVDVVEITQTQSPRDDEQALAYLSSFPDSFAFGTHRLFIKRIGI